MSNICNNRLSLSNKAYKQITHLFTESNEYPYAQPFLDFSKFAPITDGQSVYDVWGTPSLPLDTHIHTSDDPNGTTQIHFCTKGNPPIAAISALVRSQKIEVDLVSYEPSMEISAIVNYSLKNGFDPETSNIDAFLTINQSKDLDEACMEIFGCTHDHFVNGEIDEGEMIFL